MKGDPGGKPDPAGAINDMRQCLESARAVHVTNAHALEFERCGHPACLNARRVQEWLRNLDEQQGRKIGGVAPIFNETDRPEGVTVTTTPCKGDGQE